MPITAQRVADWFGEDLPTWLAPTQYRDDMYAYEGYQIWGFAVSFIISRAIFIAVWIAACAAWGLFGVVLGWVPAYAAQWVARFVFRLIMPLWLVVWFPLLTAPIWVGGIMWILFPPARPL